MRKGRIPPLMPRSGTGYPTRKHKSGRSAPRGASFAEPFAHHESASFERDDSCYDADSRLSLF